VTATEAGTLVTFPDPHSLEQAVFTHIMSYSFLIDEEGHDWPLYLCHVPQCTMKHFPFLYVLNPLWALGTIVGCGLGPHPLTD
jgi:hypothetical protein